MTTNTDDGVRLRKVPCCPECDSLDVVRRVRLGGYRCKQCPWIGPNPDERAPRARPWPLRGLPGKLLEMDPDEVGGGST